jgi:hypothetical protein
MVPQQIGVAPLYAREPQVFTRRKNGPPRAYKFVENNMSIVIPCERRIICHDDESYTLPINILDPRQLTEYDEELIAAMAEYRPRTSLREGDFVILTEIPYWLRKRETLPRCWKVRFVITSWAYDLMKLVVQYGQAMSIVEAKLMLRTAASRQSLYDPRGPMVFGHGYPHGKYPDTAEWLPERALRRTMFQETTMPWQEIVAEAGAEYRGYDSDLGHFLLDFAPDNYAGGSNIGRPFVKEEPLVNTLYLAGLEEMLELPYVIGDRMRIKELDRDHEVFNAPTEARDDYDDE